MGSLKIRVVLWSAEWTSGTAVLAEAELFLGHGALHLLLNPLISLSTFILLFPSTVHSLVLGDFFL